MYLFIFNPIAGRGRSKTVFEDVKRRFDEFGASYVVWETTYAGEAKVLAQKAAEEKYRNIISVGGDGTLLEVVTGLVGYDCNIGIIPAGTGNDFVRSLGIGNDHIRACDVILSGNIGNVDLGSSNGNFFVNIAGAGFDTEVIRYTEKYKKRFSGIVAYLLGVLKALIYYGNQPMRITMDGKTIEKKMFLIAVANGFTYGGGMKVAPNADPFDGYFDITFFEEIEKIKVLFYLVSFIKGKHNVIKNIKNYRCKEVTIETLGKSLPVNMDGEIIGSTPTTFKIMEQALKMFVPAVER